MKICSQKCYGLTSEGYVGYKIATEPENSSIAVSQQPVRFGVNRYIDMGWRCYPVRGAACLSTRSQLQPTNSPENGMVGNLFDRSIPMTITVSYTDAPTLAKTIPATTEKLATWLCDVAYYHDTNRSEAHPATYAECEEYVRQKTAFGYCNACREFAEVLLNDFIVTDKAVA